MALQLKTAPDTEPVSTADAKAHLRYSDNDQDTLIDALVKAARESVEAYTGRALITQTWQLFLDEFPAGFDRLKAPLQAVSSIKYIDTAGVEQTLAADQYKVDTAALGRIVPAYGVTWPSTRAEANAVTVEFVAGYGVAATDVPADIIHAIKLLVGLWFRETDGVSFSGTAQEMPFTVKWLLDPYRVFHL